MHCFAGYHVHRPKILGALCRSRGLYVATLRCPRLPFGGAPFPVQRMITLDPASPTPLVSQIVDGFRRVIADQTLRPGSKLPSIRALAAQHAVSVFTVVEAYDRLVAQGWVVSKSNAGFFVKRRQEAAAPLKSEAPISALRFDARMYLRQIFENRHLELKPGSDWLPNDWLFEEGVRRSLRQLASDGVELGGYGLPHGHMALRLLIAESLTERHIPVDAENI